MLSFLTKKKIDHNRLANVFVNSLLDVVDEGFPEVKACIEDDPLFSETPQMNNQPINHFLMIVVVGNMKFLSNHFSPEDCNALEPLIKEKLANVFDCPTEVIEKKIDMYESYMSRVNHPSKNTLYAMSKAVFHKYELNNYQESYFKSLQVPNPIFLKKLDDIMSNFIWDWEAFFKKYKVS